MKIFWPSRSAVKGFSIENLAGRYREKISKISSHENSSHLSNDMNLKPLKDNFKRNANSKLSLKKGHWANRDFSEYRDVA